MPKLVNLECRREDIMSNFLVIKKNLGYIFRVKHIFTQISLLIFLTLVQPRGHHVANFDIFKGMRTPGTVHLDLNYILK